MLPKPGVPSLASLRISVGQSQAVHGKDLCSYLMSMTRPPAVPAFPVVAGAAAASRQACILLAVSNPRRATRLAALAAGIAQSWGGQVVVSHVVRPGRQTSRASETHSESTNP